MRVICMNDKGFYSDIACPQVGDILTVEKSCKSPFSGVMCYTFVEYPPESRTGEKLFHQWRFSPISDNEHQLDNTEKQHHRI